MPSERGFLRIHRQSLTSPDHCNQSLENSKVNEGSIRKHLTFKNTNAIQVYTHPTPGTGALYLEENPLLFIISGKIILAYGAMEEQACNCHLLFLKKEILIAYKMEACDEGQPVECILFTVRPDVVTEFAKMADLSVPIPQHPTPFVIANTDEKFSSFISSIRVCKFYPKNVQSGLNKIKLMELLFILPPTSQKLLHSYCSYVKVFVQTLPH